MNARVLLGVVALGAIPAVAAAQHGGGAQPLVTHAPTEAAQFDFLVGQWELVVKPQATSLAAKLHGAPKLQGTWKAWRALSGWGIEDELRIVDASGNPRALSHFVRVYDAASKHWVVAAIDAYRAKVTTSTAEWRGSEMVATSQGTDDDGKVFTGRTRIFAITATAFKYQMDRSYDGGKTWNEGLIAIEGKRVAAEAPR